MAGVFGMNYHRTMQAQLVAAQLAAEEANVEQSTEETETAQTYSSSTGEIDDLLALQEAVDEDIQAQMNSQSYSIENPYVLLNPYAVSPLTAICAFTTEENTTVSMTAILLCPMILKN